MRQGRCALREARAQQGSREGARGEVAGSDSGRGGGGELVKSAIMSKNSENSCIARWELSKSAESDRTARKKVSAHLCLSDCYYFSPSFSILGEEREGRLTDRYRYFIFLPTQIIAFLL